MEEKKHPKANLEKYRLIFILFGLAISFTIVFLIMNISKTNVKVKDLQGNTDAFVEEEHVKVTRQDVKPPPPPPSQEQVSDIIEVVDDDVKIEDNYDFDMDVDDETAIDFEDVDFSEDDDETVVEEPVVWAEQMPEFPGGTPALKAYIAEHIEYPELAKENDIQGTVYLRFVVTKSGKVGEVQITRGVDPLLDEEAKRVVKELPDFKPGMQGGRTVPVWYSVPIVFQLSN